MVEENNIFGILIDKFDREKKLTLKKLSLILCIILVLGSLIFFKYSNFLIENINSIFTFISSWVSK